MRCKSYLRSGKLFALFISVVFALALCIGSGCGDGKKGMLNRSFPGIPGTFLGHDGCGNYSHMEKHTDVHEVEVCLEYQYDGLSLLTFTHLDASFNCCLDSLVADIWYEDHVIHVDERSYLHASGCDCHCPYDMKPAPRRLCHWHKHE
jgi:hypothetical protein